MNHTFLIATNYHYINLALNCCLSIKSNDKNVKVGLVYCPSEVKELQPLINKYFDAKLEVENTMSSPIEFAFYLKTDMYELATSLFPEAEAYLYLDSDLMMLPNRKVSDWFDEHNDKIFTAYCNDMYDYKTKTRKRQGYTFWCDPEQIGEIIEMPEGAKMPQINSSFVYFKKSETMRNFFKAVRLVYRTNLPLKTYKGFIPDEFCFNVACATTNILPHRNTYCPVFFQFAIEWQSDMYMLHQYSIFGFAGTVRQASWIVDFYNKLANYYREFNGVALKFSFDQDEIRTIKDPNPIQIEPITKGTFFRAGELPNSDGGVFNPDALDNGLTIFRKELNLDVYKGYSGTTGIPHVTYEGRSKELKMVGFPEGLRIEDFRLFEHGFDIMCNHTLVYKDKPNDRHIACGLSVINGDEIQFWQVPKLPIKTGRTEKNWVYFSDGYIHLIYSVNPYLLFKYDGKDWVQCEVESPQLEWFHKGEYLCNSTNPILVGEHYLMFAHTKQAMRFFQMAILIDKNSKEITHYTRNSIPLRNIVTDGIHKGLFYLSGSVVMGDKLRLLFGEGDSIASYNDYDLNSFINEIKKYPV